METAIFAYLGLFLFNSRYHWNFWLSFIAIAACVASRAVMIPSLSLLANWLNGISGYATLRSLSKVKDSSGGSSGTASNDNRRGVFIDGRMQIVLWFAGLRGAMSFALVENIPLFDTVTGQGSRFKPELKADDPNLLTISNLTISAKYLASIPISLSYLMLSTLVSRAS